MIPQAKRTSSRKFVKALKAYIAGLPEAESLKLDAPGTSSLAAWFLGPKAENLDLFQHFAQLAINAHYQSRQDYFPEDPVYVTDEVKQSPEYQQTVEDFHRHYENLLHKLQNSAPFYSYRHQGHMLWDITMPGALGFFAAMLYNQNNVAAEASPITTVLEQEVGQDLCRMLGFTIPTDEEIKNGAIEPWGHITCDGSVANLEGMWAARNLKYYPISVAEALKYEPDLAAARYMGVPLLNGEYAILTELDTWTLLNLKGDDILNLTTRIEQEYGIPQNTLNNALDKYSIQSLGFQEFSRRFLHDVPRPAAIFAPATMHYSWPKNAAILGIGKNNVVGVPVDLDARMDITELRTKLDQCLATRRPVIMTVVVLGSTEESAVDPLAEILAMREEYRHAGLEFPIHVDAAWGGYFASMLRPDPHAAKMKAKLPFIPELAMSDYVNQQYQALGAVDSITVDPHKAGYIPYPAGGLCYRNIGMRYLVAFTAPVVFHESYDATVGIYGVEGSKPGAAAAATWLSHRIIRTNQTGYGKILSQCMFNSKRIYAAMITMPEEKDDFLIAFLQRLPAERQGESPAKVKAQIDYIRQNIVPKSNQEIIQDQTAMNLLKELGSDQIIITYAFNFKVNGVPNKDVKLVNQLNQAIYNKLSLSPTRDEVLKTPMIVTSSQFDPAVYGHTFVEEFKQRLGVEGDPDTPIYFLITTTMDPWLTDTATGNFIPTLIDVLRNTLSEVILEIQQP